MSRLGELERENAKLRAERDTLAARVHWHRSQDTPLPAELVGAEVVALRAEVNALRKRLKVAQDRGSTLARQLERAKRDLEAADASHTPTHLCRCYVRLLAMSSAADGYLSMGMLRLAEALYGARTIAAMEGVDGTLAALERAGLVCVHVRSGDDRARRWEMTVTRFRPQEDVP